MQIELDGKGITLLKKGSYFGELSLLRDMRRTASVRVVSETCDLFVLTKVTQPSAGCVSHAFYLLHKATNVISGSCVLCVLCRSLVQVHCTSDSYAEYGGVEISCNASALMHKYFTDLSNDVVHTLTELENASLN